MGKTKKWLFAGVLLLVAGALVFVIGMAVLNWDFYKLDTTEYIEKSFVAAPEDVVERVEVDVDSFPVVVESGEQIALSYYEASDSEVEVKIEEGVLKIREDHKFDLVNSGMFNFGRLKKKYRLSLPQAVALTVKGVNGDIRLKNIELQDVVVNVTNLDAAFENCIFGNVGIYSTNCDVRFIGCRGNEVDFHATNIDFTVRNSNFSSVNCSGINTDVEVTDSECPEMSFIGTNADFEIERVIVNILYVKGTNLDADIYITGVKSEYTVETSGRGLPSEQTGTTDKKISLRGTNNDVSLNWSA